jgi:hypothetical protein
VVSVRDRSLGKQVDNSPALTEASFLARLCCSTFGVPLLLAESEALLQGEVGGLDFDSD